MNRYLITNTDKFTGQAELVYNATGTLIIIDCSNTDMPLHTMQHFKQAVPVSEAGITAAFHHPTVVVQAGYNISFEQFYKAYPLKRNRYKAEKQWARLNETERIKAYHSLAAYKAYLHRNPWQTPMLADTYLSRKEFETEWHKIK
ncbi:MAG TPA: hypothetical protein PKC39_14645 [Ferruginibacter sp.]|nr:hypothetical protein [Ferruginibacter sp.]HMP22195.1 hypothetical protein [Ferruginibacter sp.]